MVKTYTEVERIIADRLTQSTGTHMLDSGFANGRAWQQNQRKVAERAAAEGREVEAVEVFAAEPPAHISEHGYCTFSLYHWLVDRLGHAYDAELAEAFAEFAKDSHNSWLADMEHFAEVRQEASPPGKYAEVRLGTVNSYNSSGLLSQDIQFTYWTEGDDRTRILVSIHGGADIRGGYSEPLCFTVDSSEELFYLMDYDRATFGIYDRTPPVNDDQLTIDGKSPRDPIGNFVWEYDTMHGFSRESVDGELPDLGEEWDDPLAGEWDPERGTFRAPDGNGWIWVDPPYGGG